jgi:hypothetical protein
MKLLAALIGRILVVALAAWLPISFAQTDSKPDFTIKEKDARVGSNIRRNNLEGSNLPLNRSYEQLSPIERMIVHSLYEHIADGDEPPFPLNGLKDIYGPLDKAQQILADEGKLFVVATVGSDGEVKAVSVQEAPSKKMSTFAANVLLLTKFKPAKCSGQPCRMDFPVQLNFYIKH